MCPKRARFCDIVSLVDGHQPGQPRFLSSRHQHLTLRRRPSPRCVTFPLVTAVTNGRLGTLSVSSASFGTSPPDNKLRGIGFSPAGTLTSLGDQRSCRSAMLTEDTRC